MAAFYDNVDLKDGNNNTYYPRTDTNSVYDMDEGRLDLIIKRVLQSINDNKAYIELTDKLTAPEIKATEKFNINDKAHIQYNETDETIEFIF